MRAAGPQGHPSGADRLRAEQRLLAPARRWGVPGPSRPTSRLSQERLVPSRLPWRGGRRRQLVLFRWRRASEGGRSLLNAVPAWNPLFLLPPFLGGTWRPGSSRWWPGPVRGVRASRVVQRIQIQSGFFKF